MKKFLGFLVLFFLSSCNDSLDRNNAVNKYLDSQIAERISKLLTKTNNLNRTLPIDISKMDQRLKEMSNSISIYNSCESISKKADQYFSELADQLQLDKRALIYIQNVHSKPDIIVAIKKNELVLLDKIRLAES